MTPRAESRSRAVGIALSARGMTALWPDGRIERMALAGALEGSAAIPGEALAEAFLDLAARAREYETTEVAIAVLPPLAEGRVLDLPPVSLAEAEAIIRRSPAAHFLVGGEPVLVGLESVGTEEASDGRFGAAVPRALADAIHGAAVDAGLSLVRLVPAHSAWLAALRDTGELEADALVAVVGGTSHIVRLGLSGRVRHRRVSGVSPALLSDALGAPGGPVAVCGEATNRADVRAGLASLGFDAFDTGRSAEELAAANAEDARIEFVPARLAMAWRDRSRRTLVRMVSGALLLIVAAGVVQLWGANRSLERLRSWRADIRDEVSPLLAMSDSIARLESRRSQIEALEGSGPGWAIPLIEVSVLLPEDAYLEGVQVLGDTLFLSAVAGRAGAVVEALRGASELDGLRIEGSIQREVVDGETAYERFRLRAVRGSDWLNEDGASDGDGT